MPTPSISEIHPECRLAAIWRLARDLPDGSYREELRAAVMIGPIIDTADALAKLDAVRCEMVRLIGAETALIACEDLAAWLAGREGGPSPLG